MLSKNNQTSARYWWKSASQLVGRNPNNSVIPPLNCSNNIVYDDAEKAEAFNTTNYVSSFVPGFSEVYPMNWKI
jgi:hypothetical protein